MTDTNEIPALPRPEPSDPAEALLFRNLADAQAQLAKARDRLERARKRVVALEAVVDHWQSLIGQLRRRQRAEG